MGRCGLCGKLLDGNNVVMYPVDVAENQTAVTQFGNNSEGFYKVETTGTRMLPCCIPCVEKNKKEVSERNKTLFMLVAFAAIFLLFYAFFNL